MKTLINTISSNILDLGITGFDDEDSVLRLLLLKNDECALAVRVVDNRNYIVYSYQDSDKYSVAGLFEQWFSSLITNEESILKLFNKPLFRQTHNEDVYERLIKDSLLKIDECYNRKA